MFTWVILIDAGKKATRSRGAEADGHEAENATQGVLATLATAARECLLTLSSIPVSSPSNPPQANIARTHDGAHKHPRGRIRRSDLRYRPLGPHQDIAPITFPMACRCVSSLANGRPRRRRGLTLAEWKRGEKERGKRRKKRGGQKRAQRTRVMTINTFAARRARRPANFGHAPATGSTADAVG